ncbi:MAG: glutamate--tRNA ligase [Thermoanaerobaculia bacterium]|nr:glutamate--tRNA ligase [Thermoanaerobaculia bacterium]
MTTTLSGPVRVRFAPSPTGNLHVGGARTAIYNELLVKSLGGAFILRIEDTDRERSDDAKTRQIIDAMHWLGISVDEGPFLQSERYARHSERAAELLSKGLAYRDFRSSEAIEEVRKRAHAEGVTLKSLAPEPTAEETERRLAAGDPSVVRFRMPEEEIVVHDLVRGDVSFPAEVHEDLVILRADGSPTYHLSVVCDDIDMAVDLVLRGEDHLSNTPKHIALFRALGATVPRFGHLPLILGADKKRLSKRTGATSVEEFQSQGILPQALYNYLVLLGWSPGDDREVMTKDEIVAAFTAARLGGSASVFDVDKLAWMNTQYMVNLSDDEFMPQAKTFLPAVGLAAEANSERMARALTLHRVRSANLVELAEQVGIYFSDEVEFDETLSRKYLRKDENLVSHLTELSRRFATSDFTVDALDGVLRALAEEVGVGAGALIHPTRMALSGSKSGPPLFDLVALMGSERTEARMAQYGEYLAALPPEAEG